MRFLKAVCKREKIRKSEEVLKEIVRDSEGVPRDALNLLSIEI